MATATTEVLPINNVLGLLVPPVDPAYYSPEFKQMIEDHLNYMKNYKGATEADALVKLVPIGRNDDQKLSRYTGDWYGFLRAMGYAERYHWAILRFNGTRDPLSLKIDLKSFWVPDAPYLDKLARLCKEKRA